MRILVVDGDWAAAGAVQTELQAAGHEVQLAYDGQDAVAFARTFGPDIVILDLDLPRLGGLDAARHIRGKAGIHPVRFIALTTSSAPKDRALTAQAGFSAHLAKPVNLVALQTALSLIRSWSRS